MHEQCIRLSALFARQGRDRERETSPCQSYENLEYLANLIKNIKTLIKVEQGTGFL